MAGAQLISRSRVGGPTQKASLRAGGQALLLPLPHDFVVSVRSMNRFHPPSLLVWITALVLLTGGSAYIARGVWMPWQTNHDIDLKSRDDEYTLFADGIYPHGRVAAATGHAGITNYTVYPPYAFVMFAPIFAPPGYAPDRALFQLLSLAALGLMAIYGAAQLRFAGLSAAALGAVLPLAFSGNFVALFQGQFSIISTALVVAQIWLLRSSRPHMAGACWALAMIKPQIAVAFAVLFFIGDRRQLYGLLTGAVVLAGLSGLALAWTGTSPENLVMNAWLSHHLGFMSAQKNAAGLWVGASGLSPWHATFAVVLLLCAIAGGALYLNRGTRRILSIEQAAGACAALGSAGFYHVHYDNMMLFPLLLALVAAAFRDGRILLFVFAALLGCLCYAEPGLVVGLASTNTVFSWLAFALPLAAAATLICATRRDPAAN
jgi:hypothetical protein